jgi:hypothetical protein
MNEPASVEAAPGDFFGTSRDGKTLVYRRMTGMNKGNLVLRERSTGTETTIAVHDELQTGGIGSLWPQVSPDGTRVIYRALTNPSGHYQVSTTGGASKFVIAFTRFNLATDWSPDGKEVIGECTPTTDGICALDVEVGEVRTLLKDAEGGNLLYPSYSWDGKWVTFMLRRAGRTVICVTPVRNGSLRGESEWVRISPQTADASRPRFSPDGATIYYELVQGTTRRLVKQRVDPVTKRPSGSTVQLATVRQPADFSVIGIVTVTNDRVFFNTVETRSNLWFRRTE